MHRRYVWIGLFLLAQCVVGLVLPSVLMNSPWPSFDGLGSTLVNPEYLGITGPVVLVILVLQGGLMAPMTTDLLGRPRDREHGEGRGPGILRIVAAAGAVAAVVCVPIGYLVTALGQAFSWARIRGLDYNLVPLITLVAAAVITGFMVPMLRERWKRGIPIKTSIMVAGLVCGLLLAVVVCAAVQVLLLLTSNASSSTIGYAMLAAPVAGWIISTPILFAYVRNSHQVEPMDRVVTLIFKGTAIEALAILPLDVIVRRQRSCYCFEPSFWSLLMIGGVGLVTLGPMLIFIAGRKNRRAVTGRCTGCGYDLSGLHAKVCPECGRPGPASSPPSPGSGASSVSP